ncbi:MAG: hypothetical protein V3U72_02825 [Candidatus Aenigmarchaeota archaeon]
MKHHVSVIRSTSAKRVKTDSRLNEISKERLKIQKEIGHLENELDTAKKLNKFAVGRELNIIELKKKIEKLEKNK